MRKPKPDEMITLKQASEIYGFKVNYLQGLALRGRLKCKKFGSQWATTAADMEKFIKSRVVRGVYKKNVKNIDC